MVSSQCFPTTTSLFRRLWKIPPLLNKHNSDDRLSNVLCWDNKIAPVFLKIKHFTTSHCALKAHKTNCIVPWFTFISTLWSWFYLLSLSERFIWSINDECKLPGLQQSINMGSDTAISLRLMFKWLRIDIALEEWTCFQISAWLGGDKRAVGGQHLIKTDEFCRKGSKRALILIHRWPQITSLPQHLNPDISLVAASHFQTDMWCLALLQD